MHVSAVAARLLILTAVAVSLSLAVPVTLTQAATAGRLNVAIGVAGSRTLFAGGTAKGVPKGARALLEVRSHGRTKVRSRVVVRAGRLQLRWRVPRSLSTVRARVRIVRSRRSNRTAAVGAWRTLRLKGLAKALPLAQVTASRVVSTPPPGTAGAVVISGTGAVTPGSVIALPVTRAAPQGLLARVTDVSSADGQTTAQTVPAAIPEVLPAGSLELQIPERPASRRTITRAGLGQRMDRAASCDRSAQMSASATASFSAGIRFSTDWGFSVSRGLTLSASFEGFARASAEVEASISGRASCTLKPVPLLPVPVSFGTYAFTVGPVPVVVHPEGQLYLSAEAQVQAALTTHASASLGVTAGVRYDGNAFRAYGGITPSFDYQPPTLTAGGSATVAVAPTLDVLFYGVAGPRIDFSAGLALQSDLAADPWWKLTLPMSLGAQLRLHAWKFGLESDRFQVWSAEPTLASADGPSDDPPPEDPSETPVKGPGTRAWMTWNNDADVDLHIWDEDGDHTYFNALDAIPDARLLQDIIPGYGPEEFVEDDNRGRTYTYGICVYAGDGSDVALELTDPGGQTRTFNRTLEGEKAAALVSASPAGADAYIPDPGWCGDDDPLALDEAR